MNIAQLCRIIYLISCHLHGVVAGTPDAHTVGPEFKFRRRHGCVALPYVVSVTGNDGSPLVAYPQMAIIFMDFQQRRIEQVLLYSIKRILSFF